MHLYVCMHVCTKSFLKTTTNSSCVCTHLANKADSDHNILLNRLENFVGISGSALAWFKSYLSDRHQFVAVNEEVSYQSQVQYGVPQGLSTRAVTFHA